MDDKSKKVSVPASLQDKVIEIEGPVVPADVDAYARLREIEDKSHKLRTVLKAWENQQTQERSLRSSYATALLVGLGVQAVAVNTAFFLIGAGVITVDQWVANGFILSVFGEIAAMTFVVVRYLFPKVGADVLALIEKL